MTDTVRIKTSELTDEALTHVASWYMPIFAFYNAVAGNTEALRDIVAKCHDGDYADVPRELVEET